MINTSQSSRQTLPYITFFAFHVNYQVTYNDISYILVQAAGKRFRVTGGGLVVRRRNGKQHLNERKSRVRLNRLGKMVSCQLSCLSTEFSPL